MAENGKRALSTWVFGIITTLLGTAVAALFTKLIETEARLTRLETRHEYVDTALRRIDAKIDTLLERPR